MEILKNYKTTIAAILTLISVILYWCRIIDTEKFITGTALLISSGLILSKDYDNK
jgi:hypothetical protein